MRLHRYQKPRGRGLGGALEQAGDVQLVDGPAGEAQHGRQQGDGGRHDQHHGGDGPDGQAAHEGQLQDEQAEQREDHRGAGEHHRPARGGQGHRGGLARGPALGQALPVAGHDEQGVVDAHARGRSWPSSRGRRSGW